MDGTSESCISAVSVSNTFDAIVILAPALHARHRESHVSPAYHRRASSIFIRNSSERRAPLVHPRPSSLLRSTRSETESALWTWNSSYVLKLKIDSAGAALRILNWWTLDESFRLVESFDSRLGNISQKGTPSRFYIIRASCACFQDFHSNIHIYVIYYVHSAPWNRVSYIKRKKREKKVFTSVRNRFCEAFVINFKILAKVTTSVNEI